MSSASSSSKRATIKQHGVCPHDAGVVEIVPGETVKSLRKTGSSTAARARLEVLRASAEMGTVGQHRQACAPAPAAPLTGDLGRIEAQKDVAFRGRAPFYLGDEGDRLARNGGVRGPRVQGRDEIAGPALPRPRLQSQPRRRAGQTTAASTVPRGDAVEVGGHQREPIGRFGKPPGPCSM